MPKLANPKHEAFAYQVAKGMGMADSYVHAGYKDSGPSATRLSKQPDVAARIEELREDFRSKAKAIADVPSEENAVALVNAGLSLDWCINEFKDIAEKAKSAGQFAPANQAVKNIQSILEIKSAKDPDNATEEKKKYSLDEIGDVAGLLAKISPDQPKIIDVTPPPAVNFDLDQIPEIVPVDDNE